MCKHDGQKQYIDDSHGISRWYCMKCGTTIEQYEDLQGG